MTPMRADPPQEESHAVGLEFELSDHQGHGIASCLGLSKQLVNLSPVDLVGNGAPHNKDGLVYQVLVELW